MEIVTNALLLRSVDYGENDKMATLFTAEKGKLGVCFKGVKRANAKLKFAAQPFCFAEYTLAEQNGRHTVTSASLHDGFYPLRENVLNFYAATAVCEACDKLLFEGMVNGELLVQALKALRALCGAENAMPLVEFLLSALSLAGYPVRAERCPRCGGEITGRCYFDMEGGTFTCEGCAKGTPASEVTYKVIKSALNGEEISCSDGEKRALKLLSAYLYYQAGAELSALAQYIELL